MKFKVGDRVRLKEELVVGESYGGFSLLECMKFNYYNEILERTPLGNYKIKPSYDSNFSFTYSEEMLEGFKFKVGDKVVLNKELKDGGSYDGLDFHTKMRFEGTDIVKSVDCQGDVMLEGKDFFYSQPMLEHYQFSNSSNFQFSNSLNYKVGDKIIVVSPEVSSFHKYIGEVGKIIGITKLTNYYYKVQFEGDDFLTTHWSDKEIELYDPNQDEEIRVYTFQEMVDELSKSIEDREIEVKTSFGEQYRGKLSDILLVMGTRCSSKRIINEISKSEWRIVD